MYVRHLIDKIIETNNISYDEIFETKNKVYSFINPYGYHIMRIDQSYYEQLDGLFVDGMLMCKLIRALYGHKITRRAFDNTSMATRLFSYLNEKDNKTIFFLGAKEDEVSKAVQNYMKSYPKMSIVGYNSGYFASEEERDSIIMKIINLQPDFCIVGMGAKLQEDFLIKLKGRGYNGIAFSCGGFIRQSSEKLEYFPHWVDRFNLRAFYRLYKEKGMFKRLYNVLIQFPIQFSWDRFFGHHRIS